MECNLDPSQASSSNLPEAPVATVPRVILLVARPLEATMNRILSTLGAKIPRLTPPMSDWDPTDAPPRVSRNLCFARHMAICVVSSEIWSDGARAFRDRFSNGKFWEHLGSASTATPGEHAVPGDCAIWRDAQIESIESVEILGTIRLSDWEITKSFTKLMGSWNYMPVWWNCQDFAIRFGYILMGGDCDRTREIREILQLLLMKLRMEMRREVIEWRGRVLGKYLSHVQIQIGFFTTDLSILEVGCMRSFDWYRRRLWQSYIAQVEKTFALKELHGDLKDMY